MHDDLYCDQCAPYPCNCYPVFYERPEWLIEAENAQADMEEAAREDFWRGVTFPQCYEKTLLPNMETWALIPSDPYPDDIPF